MGISLKDIGNFAVGAIKQDEKNTAEKLLIRREELKANRDFFVKQKEKKYDRELKEYYKEKEKFDTINKANEMYNLNSIDARTYAATILPLTNPNWKNLDDKTKQSAISNFDGKTIDYKLVGNEEEINKQAAMINQEINKATSQALRDAKGDSFLISKILGDKKQAEVNLLKEVEEKIKAADAVSMTEKTVNPEYVGKDVKVSSSSSAFSNDPNADKYQTEWAKQRDRINFDILKGDKGVRFLNSAAISGGSDELSFKYDKTDSQIVGLNEPSIAHVEAIRNMFNQIKNSNDTMIKHYNTVTKLYGNIGKTWNEETIFKQMEKEIPNRVGNINQGYGNPLIDNVRLTTVVPLSIIPLGATINNKPIDKNTMKSINTQMNDYILQKTKVLKDSNNYKDRTTQQIANLVYQRLYTGDEDYINEFTSNLKINVEKPVPTNITNKKSEPQSTTPQSKSTPAPKIRFNTTIQKGKEGLAINNKFKSWEEIEAAGAVKDLPEKQKLDYQAWKNKQGMSSDIQETNPMA